MVKISVGDTMSAETTGNPLRFTPRFDLSGPQVIVAGYTNPEGRERQRASTFGSMQWLWSENDEFRFDQHTRELSSVTFFLPREAAPAPACHRVPDGPRTLPGGLRADAAQDFALPQTTIFYCAPDGAELRCFRDSGALDRALEARIGIAPDVDLLVQEGEVAGWSLADPARYLTDGFADPEATLPSPATRLRLAECLDLVSSPLVEEVMDQDADAWNRVRATERALREQRDDRYRVDVLQRVVSRLIEDYEP
jgi:hypothetical protein